MADITPKSKVALLRFRNTQTIRKQPLQIVSKQGRRVLAYRRSWYMLEFTWAQVQCDPAYRRLAKS